MFSDLVNYAKVWSECAITNRFGRRMKPTLQLIPVHRPFQLLAIDVVDLPLTKEGNCYVGIQDLFTKWPFMFMYAIFDQKVSKTTCLLAEEVIPNFGVPELLLSDRCINFVTNVIWDLCMMLGISLNKTAYHPQCDRAVERFNTKVDSAETCGLIWEPVGSVHTRCAVGMP